MKFITFLSNLALAFIASIGLTAFFFTIALTCLGCGRGPAGPSGADGVSITGAKGEVGSTGPQGAPGSDASSVTVVELCPGVTTYPSTFVEIAFCAQGKLYGTYSAHGGFSTELPPGTYSSHGINSDCTFTVGANCMVTR